MGSQSGSHWKKDNVHPKMNREKLLFFAPRWTRGLRLTFALKSDEGVYSCIVAPRHSKCFAAGLGMSRGRPSPWATPCQFHHSHHHYHQVGSPLPNPLLPSFLGTMGLLVELTIWIHGVFVKIKNVFLEFASYIVWTKPCPSPRDFLESQVHQVNCGQARVPG